MKRFALLLALPLLFVAGCKPQQDASQIILDEPETKAMIPDQDEDSEDENSMEIGTNGELDIIDGEDRMEIDANGNVRMKTEEGDLMEVKTDDQDRTTVETTSPGLYIDYDPALLTRYADREIVLFFKADWCPNCIALDRDVRAHLANIPEDVVILKVNYDNAADLKTKYGVTYQHTFVRVDGQGNKLELWNGSPTLQDLLSHI